MTIRLGVVMDPIESINPKKDSTLAMLLAAQQRGWDLLYMRRKDLFLRDGRAYGHMREVTVNDNNHDWHSFPADPDDAPLDTLDAILMRLDPPANAEYLYAAYLLQLAQERGVLVVNSPESLRLINEKLYISRFRELCTPTLVTSQRSRLKAFLEEQHDIIIKPLDGMGGRSVFRIRIGDTNTGVILETMTGDDRRTVMAQRYIPQISAGDKRILLIDGQPVPYALARIPLKGENRGNLAAGGRGEGRELSERDRQICAQVGPVLREQGVLFAGLDVIGDYLTEINITSPTCIRELNAIYGLDIAGQLMDVIAVRLEKT
jgi:glutathione synthase